MNKNAEHVQNRENRSTKNLLLENSDTISKEIETKSTKQKQKLLFDDRFLTGKCEGKKIHGELSGVNISGTEEIQRAGEGRIQKKLTELEYFEVTRRRSEETTDTHTHTYTHARTVC